VTRRFDLAMVCYWRVQLIEPNDPDDQRYVVLHGEDGEMIGPLTVALAQVWIDRFSTSGRRHPSPAPCQATPQHPRNA